MPQQRWIGVLKALTVKSPGNRTSFTQRRTAMNVDRAVMAFAGFVILISLTLAHYVSPWWLLLTAFVGVNLIQASVTGFCPAAMVFARLGLKGGCAFPDKR
jgi:Protein of unknown function (DUF2892)